MEEHKFIVKIVGIIFKPEKRQILIGRNKGENKYSFLEGDLSYDEELDQGLKRITTEKTGYIIHNLGAVYAENNLSSRPDKLKLHFLCEATEGEERPGQDVEELLWISPLEIEEKLEVKLPTRLRDYILSLA